MKKRIKRILIGVLIGLVILVGVVWLLSKTLGDNYQTLYAGRSIAYWQQQLNSHDAGASNQAIAVVNAQVIPQIVDQMFHDTNDSKLRLSVIDTLNGLPGVQVYFTVADGRRCGAAGCLGEIGPAAKAAVPALIEALKGKDSVLHESAIQALGKIHSDPDVVIPLLVTYLDDDSLNDEAAAALGNFGSLAKGAIPKIMPLLHAKDKDAQAAAKEALKKIDPVAAAQAENDLLKEMLENSSTNSPNSTGAK
jgi:HEAT repeat protein